MKPQILYSRYEYDKGNRSAQEVFAEYSRIFNSELDERGVQVGGVSVAIDMTRQTVILISYDEEADAFLRLKFYGRKDVKFHNCRLKVKVENE